MIDLTQLTLTEAHQGLIDRKYSSQELTQSALDQIKKVDPEINAFITTSEILAQKQAQAVDERLKRGDQIGYLSGLPLAIKDNITTQGIKTTAGSKILENYIPPYTATAVERLFRAGAVMVGKTNCDEFGMGASGENSAYGPTKNPWDKTRVPGGSSSGSAAALTAGECLFALGTDTGGSVRQPAGFCNLIGLKPTYGRVSRYGLIALASSLDQIGIFTQTVEEAAIVLHEIAGFDPYDSTSVKTTVPNYFDGLKKNTKNIRVGVPKEFFIEGMESETEKVVRLAIDQMSQLGYEVIEVSLPHTAEALAVYYLIQPAEASSNLARYDGIRYGRSVNQEVKNIIDIYHQSRSIGLGPEVKRRIMLGTFVLSAGYYEAYYRKAQQVRTLIVQDYQNVFKQVDCLITPTSPTPPFKLGEKYEDPLTMYLSDIFTVSINIAGLPAISIPSGFVKGLPIGLQIIGPQFQEQTLLQVAYAYQQKTDWQRQHPK